MAGKVDEMRMTRTIASFALALGLGACASTPFSETPSRNAPEGAALVASNLTIQSANWRLADVRVTVPGSLSVSEANRYYPIADIVWRGDPFGDRRAQIAKVIDDGMTNGLSHLRGDRPVYFDVTVSRFHSLTEKTRYSVGGVHNIKYQLSVVDAATGAVLHGPAKTEIALKAYGGDQAVIADRQGQTQKVRIESHLGNLMRKNFNGGLEVQIVTRDVAPQLQAKTAYTGEAG